MMSQQHKDQADLVSALIDSELPIPTDLQLPNGKSAGKRFDVYRNNVVVGLTEVLVGAFPVTEKLVGEAFFQAMAGIYIREHPPTTPILFRFGESFSDYIKGFSPAASVPYLSDIAALEQARRFAYHAADATPINPADLAAIPEVELPELAMVLHPSVQVVRSPFPIFSIWSDNTDDDALSDLTQDGSDRPSASHKRQIDLQAGEDVLVVRPSLTVDVSSLLPGHAAFISMLASGSNLQNAAGFAIEEAEMSDKPFDLASALSVLMVSGSICGLQRPETSA